jgi:hypothetical protein
MADDKAEFCPKCGSASIDCSSLVGGTAACDACNWTGMTTELVTHHFQQDLGSNEQVMAAFLTDFKQLMASTVALPLAQLLMKWGFFVGPSPTPKELARYIKAMAMGSVKALLDERRLVEKERVSHGN